MLEVHLATVITAFTSHEEGNLFALVMCQSLHSFLLFVTCSIDIHTKNAPFSLCFLFLKLWEVKTSNL